MHESRSTLRRSADTAWSPAHWSVRTKISVVLLLPVLVAVALAEIRIQSELDRATALSAARDRLPVLRDTIDLTASLGQEMVAAVAVPAGAPDTLTAAVDAKVAAVQRDIGFSPLAADTGRALNTALGKLSGIRAAGVGGGDVRTKAAGYNDIIATLGDLVPTFAPADAGSETASGAETARLIVHLRGELATEETYARAAQNSPGDASLRPAVVQTAAEQEVLAEQVEHQLSGDQLNRFKAATSSAEGRSDTLQESGTGGDAGLASFAPSIAAETTGVTAVLTDVVAKLSSDVSAAADRARSDSLRDTALVLGALLGALAIALLVVRSLVTPVRRLRAAALRAANEQLPETVRQVREGHDVDWRAVPDSGVKTEEEIGQLARAFDDMHRQAVRLAVEQAELRKQVSEMFMTLSRRSQSLVEQQLSIIEDLESGEQNPRRLDELFRIDHIATRLRRNGENLHVLAGGRPVRHGREPVPTRELLRAATSEVKDYRRVAMGNAPRSSVQPEAAADVVHILAELLENATRFSPPEHKVALTADRGADGGLLIEVVDQGLGMTPAELTTVNERLAAAGTVGPETTRRMGLFVVGRLAALHGVTVRLRATGTGARHAGVTASVHVPGALVIADLARPIGAGRLTTAGAGTGGRNGHSRPPVVPAQASTPIFEQVVTSWFVEPAAKPLSRRDAPVEWPAQADGTAAAWPPAAPNGRAARPGAPADPAALQADPAEGSPVEWPPPAGRGTWPGSDAGGRNGAGPGVRGSWPGFGGDRTAQAGRDEAAPESPSRNGTSAAHLASSADAAGHPEGAADRVDSAGRNGTSSGDPAGRSEGAADQVDSAGWNGTSPGDAAGRSEFAADRLDPAGRNRISSGGPAGRSEAAADQGDSGRNGTSSGDPAGRSEVAADHLDSTGWNGTSSGDPAGRSEVAADRVDSTGWSGTADHLDPAGRNGTTAAHRAEPAAQRAEAADGAAPGPDWPASAGKPVARPEPAAAPVGEWETRADRTRQAAESALKPAVAQRLTDAGLPTRRPGAQLAPGAVAPRVREQSGGSFRDAAAVRSSLSRHYQGMRAARQESAARAEESGKDEVDPR